MKDGWFCITVFWKTGEVQTIWVKNEKVAWRVVNDILTRDDLEKVKMTPEKERPNGAV